MASPFGNIFDILGRPVALRAGEEEFARQQELARTIGTNQSRVLSKLGELRKTSPNTPGDQIFSQVLLDPTFIDAVASGNAGDLTKLVNDMIAATQPAKPEYMTAGEGQHILGTDPNTGVLNPKPVFSAPFAPTGAGAGTQQERAVQRLIGAQALSPQEGDSILAGQTQIFARKDALGAETGEYDIVDAITGKVVKTLPPGAGAALAGVFTTPAAGAAPEPMEVFREVIGSLEADQRGYQTVGVITKKGDRAYGRYGVMGVNVPEWTDEVLGVRMTPREFLDDPAAQDAVFRAKFGQYLRDNNNDPSAAASMWFTGRPNAPNAEDPLGTTGAEYVRRFQEGVAQRGLGGAPQGAPAPPISPTPVSVGTTATAAEAPPPLSAAETAEFVGAAPAIADFVSSTFGQVDPGLIDERVAAGRASIGQLNSALRAYARAGGADINAVREMDAVTRDMGLSGGLFVTPVQALTKMIQTRRSIQDEVTHNQEIISNRAKFPSTSKMRENAAEKVNAGKFVLERLGTEAQLQTALEKARKAKPLDNFDTIWRRVTGGVSEVGKEVMGTQTGTGLSEAEFQDYRRKRDTLSNEARIKILQRMSEAQVDRLLKEGENAAQ